MAYPTLPKGIKALGASRIDDELHIFIKRDIRGVAMSSPAEFDAQIQKTLFDCAIHINKYQLSLREVNGSKTT